MAYDPATGNMILFGGTRADAFFDGTWVWDGTTWTKQAPVTHPPARDDASMAYDKATGNMVLFGGSSSAGRPLGDTWTWDGTTWTKQAPATSPSPRSSASMAYDAATGNVVLFGGETRVALFGDTWVWDGSNWIKQSPATSPPARRDATMAYDAATRTVVLFSGVSSPMVADTWVWDGATWTKQSPATHPTARFGASMAYDAATGNVVLFSGLSKRSARLGDTWTWDEGVNWAKRGPCDPPGRPVWQASMAYDAATGNVVLFSGLHGTPPPRRYLGLGALASQRSNLAHHRVSCPLRPARADAGILVTGCGVCAGRT